VAARRTVRAPGRFCGGPYWLLHGSMKPYLEALPDALFGALRGAFFGALLPELQRERGRHFAQLAQFGFAFVASGAQMLFQRARLVGFQPIERSEWEQLFDCLMVHN
jgi:hypothetical protein